MNTRSALKETSSIKNNNTVIEKEKMNSSSTIQENSELVKIVNDIETRLIQEEIKKEIDDKGEPYYSVNTLSNAFQLAFYMFVTIISLIFGVEQILLGETLLGSIIITFPNIFVIPLHAMFWKKLNKSIKHYCNIQKLRKKLLEQSLKVEIVSGAEELDDQWSEVSAIDGNRALKYLVRILQDEENGFEKIEVKKFQN